ncbi:MAG: hypothetical protein AVDCRST_MAG59-3300, partial [uncultured Thermomicrobiales bacterium]
CRSPSVAHPQHRSTGRHAAHVPRPASSASGCGRRPDGDGRTGA